MTASLRAGCRGVMPLTARLEPWQVDLCERAGELRALVAEHGSPINLIDVSPMERNAHELAEAASAAGLRLRIFFARKANKALAFVDEAKRLGLGVDVASERELSQVLDRGVDPADVIVTAAVKPEPLVELCVRSGAIVAIDNFDELELLLTVASRAGGSVAVALRLAPDLGGSRVPTRFGLQPEELLAAAQRLTDGGHEVAGLHFHLDGYDVGDRATAVGQALELIDRLHELGANPGFLDIGGGIPMSYLDSREEWDAFWDAHRGDRRGLTFDGHELGPVYPYHQQPVRGEWVAELLSGVGAAIASRDLELRCEPGRSLVDGCGLTVARVMFVKRRGDGETLIGLGMNRTQVRSTSDDFLVDPLLLPGPGDRNAQPVDGFLVGAYCIERELLSWRRLEFPGGVAVGDLVVFPNTAGYLTHILESASHQIPLARNLIVGDGPPRLDLIDASGRV
jgi:diaminopimelate decarboxylase